MSMERLVHLKKNAYHMLVVIPCLVSFLFLGLGTTSAEARRRARAVPAYAPPFSSIVVDAKTGKVLHGKNMDAKRYPASITKVMTLYVLFEQLEAGRLNLNSRMHISANAASQPPSKIGVRAGDTITVKDAIEALVTKSANDVAVVIAEYVAGSEQKFASIMTQKARALGMKNTVFRNPHGLPDKAQYTTARDLSILGRAIQTRFPVYYNFFQTRYFTYKNAVYPNHNKLLGRVEGVDGIKTGYTNASGFNLLTSAKSNNRHVVAVVLGGRSGYLRDQAMTQLVETYLPRAYAGSRIAPVLENKKLAFNSTIVAKNPKAAGEPLAINNIKAAVTASVETPADVTPSYIDKRAVTKASYEALPKNGLRFSSLPIDSDGNIISHFSRQGKGVPKSVNALPLKSPQLAQKQEVIKKEVIATKEVDTSRIDGWIIQLAATPDKKSALNILDKAKTKSGNLLVQAEPFTQKVERDDGATFYRARFSGFSGQKDALSACTSLKKNGFQCIAIRG